MAQVISGNQIKLNNGQVVQAQQGGWFDGQQFWNGTLSAPGQINPQSNQPSAGTMVSKEVIAQTNPANIAYIEQQRKQAGVSMPTAPTTPSFSQAGTTGTTGTLLPTQSAINLPELYQGLYKSSGISDLEKQYSDMERQFIEAKGKINDNPFLSEATRVGRVAKLESLFTERTANLKRDIATKKADIETQLNLQTKQFDINSQQAKQALDLFNTLLDAGALNNASGEDIANITRSTGISSSMIQGAIEAKKAKNVKTEIKTFTNDAGVVTAVVLDSNTGQVIAKQNLGAIGNAEKGTEPKKATPNEQKVSVEVIVKAYLTDKAKQAQISPEDLYRELLLRFPEAVDYIMGNWTPDRIRAIWK